MTEQPPEYQTETNGQLEDLPLKARKLARRALQLASQGDGRHTLELLIHDGRWMLIIDGGPKVEELGEC